MPIPRTLPRLPLAVLLLTCALAAVAATRDDFLYGTSNQGPVTLPFRYFVPPGYDPQQAYPLIIFLHGAGERGSDNEAQLNNNANGAMHLLDDANLAMQPVFMVAPQCWGWWSGDQLEAALRLTDQMAATWNIDRDRVYLTGLSMGGMGAWAGAIAHPDEFAAVIAMSGNGPTDATSIAKVRDLPFWFFHAANDDTVSVSGSDHIVAALRAAGADTIYTRYAGGGHAIWPVAYADQRLFTWMVAQHRGAAADLAPPVLRVMQPTAAPAWATSTASVALSGDADLGAAGIDSVAWSVVDGASGVATGTAAWSVDSIPVTAGTQLVTVMASGPSGHAAYGGDTTVNDHLVVTRAADPPAPGTVVVAINAGGPAHVAADQTLYAADRDFSGGAIQISSHAVAGTVDDALYNDWRYGNFSYHVALPAGLYTLELQFADTWNGAPGQRLFGIALEGTPILTAFDIIATAGVDSALLRRYTLRIDDGTLDLTFTNGSAGNARLDALRILVADDVIFRDGFDNP